MRSNFSASGLGLIQHANQYIFRVSTSYNINTQHYMLSNPPPHKKTNGIML